MLTKLQIVLFKPRLIALLIKEKTSSVIVMLFIAILIAISPEIIRLSVSEGISNSFRTEIKTRLTQETFSNTYISSGVLSYEETNNISLSAFDLVIGDVNEYDGKFLYVMNLSDDNITFYISSVLVYSISYDELNVENIDFNSMKYDVKEVFKLVNIVDEIYLINKTSLVIYNSVYMFIDVLFIVLATSLLFGVMSSVFSKSGLSFRYRFKTALNCQYIFLLSILLSVLYNALFLQIIGNLVMVIYVVISLTSIQLKIEKVK